jgi:2-oxoglutarate dehydrogenase E1 component
LQDRELVEPDKAEAMVNDRMRALQDLLDSLDPEEEIDEEAPESPPPGAAKQVQTGVSLERLRQLNQAMLAFPDDFSRHSKLDRPLKRRGEALEEPDEPTVDWATAETLALATILTDGTAIRFTGQDAERGTFSQRHAVFHDVEDGHAYTPLQHLPDLERAFEIRNSPLTENAALGFEFGYNIQEPERLVIWEAQYGDFINNAQVMIDEFLTSARAKWGQTPSLVLLLPHGHEGQGPDHSTGRLERFLQMAAETNMRIANCTTAAQYFHLLRRQAALLETDPLPLVVMTPKSLLRHPHVASPPQDLAEGTWQPVIDDAEAREQADQIRRLVLCSGKVYVDLVTSDQHEARSGLAIVRLEQLYPLPAEALKAIFDQFSNLEEVVWAQEEPQNMGAWRFLEPQLAKLIDGRWPLYYLGRPRSSSPAEGSSAVHKANQQMLIEQVYQLEEAVVENGIVWEESVI